MARTIAWTAQARADLRRIDREAALRVLHGLARFVSTGEGDIGRLEGIDPPELRLRVGDYRVRFQDLDEVIVILRVRDRGDAYR